MTLIYDKKGIHVSHLNVRTSIVFLLLKLVLLDIITTIIVLLFFGVLSSAWLPQEIRLIIFSSNITYFFILAGVKIIFTLFVVLQWVNEYYEITPTKIYYRRGIIWRREDIYTLSLVRSIGLQQGVLGRMFNYGSLRFYDAGVFKYYYLNYIHNPLRYLNVLCDLLPDVDIEKEVIREHMRDVEIE